MGLKWTKEEEEKCKARMLKIKKADVRIARNSFFCANYMEKSYCRMIREIAKRFEQNKPKIKPSKSTE